MCVEAQVSTWDELVLYDRPLSLVLVTPERFSAEALMLGMEGQSAWLLAESGPVQVPLAELGPLWQGRFRYVWQKPVGFRIPLSLGDSGVAVAAVARLFARLDGQDTPLTGEYFNSALDRRVRLFQSQYGLVDDGVVGVRTLVRLNELLGIDVTAAAARAQYRAGLGSGESP
jgi:general secretion pathway protein A